MRRFPCRLASPALVAQAIPLACGLMFWFKRKKFSGSVLSLNGREPVVVGTKSSFDRIFFLVTQEVQQIPTAGERTYRLCQTPSPFDMVLRLSRISPLRKAANQILGLTLRKRSFGDPNPACSPTIGT